MGSNTEHRAHLRVDDQLGRIIVQALEARSASQVAHSRGRERLLAAAHRRSRLGSLQTSRREDFYWGPPQRTNNPIQFDYNLWSAMIHARNSLRITAR